MNELKFINYLKKTIKHGKDVVCGIGDDAAVINYRSGKYMLFASDMIVEGIHFSKKDTPQDIGWKAVGINISDIAAMGGVPKYIVISASAPGNSGLKILKGIIKGAKKICKAFNINIVGGDTNRGRNLVIDTAIIGEVEKKCLVLRSGAKEGDLIFVSGALGKGVLKNLRMVPRLEEARVLVKQFRINSMCDISDGLFLDLHRLAGASNVGAFIYKSLIPLYSESTSFSDALSYGEDFELLFTLSLKEAKKLMRYIGKHEYPPVTLIGEVVSGKKGLNFVGDEGKVTKIRPRGYLHF